MRIPEEVPKRLFFVESLASDTLPPDVTFCLMLFDSEAFDMEPFCALMFTLNHDGVFIGDTIPTYAVFFGIVNLNQLSRNLS